MIAASSTAWPACSIFSLTASPSLSAFSLTASPTCAALSLTLLAHVVGLLLGGLGRIAHRLLGPIHLLLRFGDGAVQLLADGLVGGFAVTCGEQNAGSPRQGLPV